MPTDILQPAKSISKQIRCLNFYIACIALITIEPRHCSSEASRQIIKAYKAQASDVLQYDAEMTQLREYIEAAMPGQISLRLHELLEKKLSPEQLIEYLKQNDIFNTNNPYYGKAFIFQFANEALEQAAEDMTQGMDVDTEALYQRVAFLSGISETNKKDLRENFAAFFLYRNNNTFPPHIFSKYRTPNAISIPDENETLRIAIFRKYIQDAAPDAEPMKHLFYAKIPNEHSKIMLLRQVSIPSLRKMECLYYLAIYRDIITRGDPEEISLHTVDLRVMAFELAKQFGIGAALLATKHTIDDLPLPINLKLDILDYFFINLEIEDAVSPSLLDRVVEAYLRHPEASSSIMERILPEIISELWLQRKVTLDEWQQFYAGITEENERNFSLEILKNLNPKKEKRLIAYLNTEVMSAAPSPRAMRIISAIIVEPILARCIFSKMLVTIGIDNPASNTLLEFLVSNGFETSAYFFPVLLAILQARDKSQPVPVRFEGVFLPYIVQNTDFMQQANWPDLQTIEQILVFLYGNDDNHNRVQKLLAEKFNEFILPMMCLGLPFERVKQIAEDLNYEPSRSSRNFPNTYEKDDFIHKLTETPKGIFTVAHSIYETVIENKKRNLIHDFFGSTLDVAAKFKKLVEFYNQNELSHLQYDKKADQDKFERCMAWSIVEFYDEEDLRFYPHSLLLNFDCLRHLRTHHNAFLNTLRQGFYARQCYQPKIKSVINRIKSGRAGADELATIEFLMIMLHGQMHLIDDDKVLIQYLSLLYAFLNYFQNKSLSYLQGTVIGVMKELCARFNFDTKCIVDPQSAFKAFSVLPAGIIEAMPIKPDSIAPCSLYPKICEQEEGPFSTDFSRKILAKQREEDLIFAGVAQLFSDSTQSTLPTKAVKVTYTQMHRFVR